MLLEAPWAFMANVEDDRALDAEYVRTALGKPANEIVAVASPDDPSELVATAGIVRAKNPKFAHRATLWGVYVEPAQRGRGLGRAVTAAAVDLARAWEGVEYVGLGVSENAPEAQALYASLGFRPWGREPDATRVAGESYDEIFMALRLVAS